MADCGATGSVIDRAVRTLTNGNTNVSNDAAQVMSNLLGHAFRTNINPGIDGDVMTLNAPDELVLYHNNKQQQQQLHQQLQIQQQIQTQQSVPNMNDMLYHQQQQQNHQQTVARLPSQQMNVPLTNMNPQQLDTYRYNQQTQSQPMMMGQNQHQQQTMYQQQQMMQMMLMQQQQQQHQQAMMQQQQVQMMQQKQHQQQQQQKQQLINQTKFQQTQKSVKEDNIVNDNTVVGHEGIVHDISIDELSKAWKDTIKIDSSQANNVVENGGHVGHEGVVSNVDIHQLSSAWSEANNDYEKIYKEAQAKQQEQMPQEFYDNNLWTGESNTTEELDPYQFINNITADMSTMDQTGAINDKMNNMNYMDEGMEHFNDGNITAAIHSFEMELQLNDNNNASAWRMLGKCHAEHDMDREAIICLEHAVDRDPYSTDALLALGVSYVNELNHKRALQCLKSWITHNPKFATLDFINDIANTDDGTVIDEKQYFEDVQKLLQNALDLVLNSNSKTDEDMSLAADVLEALGVIQNVSRDYDAAVVSFQQAIQIRPNDYQLWNKLGATLANSNKSSDALPAYHQALRIKPKYARAWLNMAISHSNLQNYHEASRCYLQTISLNPNAVHCWSYLRIALTCDDKWDLISEASKQKLDSFVGHFDFIMYKNNKNK